MTSPFLPQVTQPASPYLAMSNYGVPPEFASFTPAAMTAQANNFMGIDPQATAPGLFSAAMPTDPAFSASVAGATGTGGGSIWDNFLTKDGNQGWGSMALGGAQGLANLFMGMKQYGLAKKSLAQNKEQFERNYAAQRTLTNSQLEDRQRARVAANSGAYESVGSYMDRNRVQ
jgi:hypothetical protein